MRMLWLTLKRGVLLLLLFLKFPSYSFFWWEWFIPIRRMKMTYTVSQSLLALRKPKKLWRVEVFREVWYRFIRLQNLTEMKAGLSVVCCYQRGVSTWTWHCGVSMCSVAGRCCRSQSGRSIMHVLTHGAPCLDFEKCWILNTSCATSLWSGIAVPPWKYAQNIFMS